MALNLCVAQRKLGIDAGICYLDGGEERRRIIEAGIPLHDVELFSSNLSRRSRWSYLEQGLKSIVTETGPDLLVSHLPLSHILSHRVRREQVGLKWVSVFHQSWKLFGQSALVRNRPLFKQYMLLRHAAGDALVAFRCDRVIAVSESVRADCLKLGTNSRKIKSVLNGIILSDSAKLSDLRGIWGIPKDCRVIGALGYYNSNKGFDLLVRAFGDVASHIMDAQLVIAGSTHFEDKAYFQELKALRDESEYSNRIHLLGEQRSGAEFMYNVDICAVSSRQESFSLVLAEGMQFGKPSVVTSAGGSKEVARDGVEGLVFESGNVRDLAAKLERLLTDAELSSRLGKAAATRAKSDLTIERCAQEHVDIYKEVLGGSAGK